LARNLPPHSKLARVFGVDQQGVGTEADGERKEYVPSLLHFSAAHGLRDLTAQLLNLPGSVKAFGTPNCNGEYPSNLAENNGHTVLKEFMDNYMEVSALIDHKTRNSSRTSELVSQMVSGHYIAHTRCDQIDGSYIDPEIEEVQAVYETLFPGPLDKPVPPLPSQQIMDGIYTTEEDYLAMKPGLFPPPPLPRDLEDDESIQQAINDAADYNFGNDLFHPDHFQRQRNWSELETPPPRPPRKTSQNDELFNRSREPSLHSVPEEKETTKTDDYDESNRTGAVMATYGEIKVEKRPNYFLSPEQEKLIHLQKQVKANKLTINEAVARYKKWKKDHRFSRNNSNFKTQQDRLKKLRLSLEKVNKNKRKSECFQCSGPIDVGSTTFADALSKMKAGSVKKKTSQSIRKDGGDAATSKADQKTKFFHFNRRQSVRHSSKRLPNIKKLASDKKDERMDNEYGESFALNRRASLSFDDELQGVANQHVEIPPTPPPRSMNVQQTALYTQRGIPSRNAPTPLISPGSSGYSSSGCGTLPPPPLPRRR